jgi:hypothetical protein
MVAIDTMPGNQTILHCHRSRFPCHPAHLEHVSMRSTLRIWWCGPTNGSPSKIVIKCVCVGKKKSKKLKLCGLRLEVWIMHLLLQLNPLPLHYITFCVFLLYSTFFTRFYHRPTAAVLGRAPTNRATSQTSHGRLSHDHGRRSRPPPCHSLSHPQPPILRSGWAPAARSQPHGGHGQPRLSCSKAVAGRTLAAAGCTKAVAGRAPTFHSWSSLWFIGQFLFGHLFIWQNGYTIVHKIYTCHLYLWNHISEM